VFAENCRVCHRIGDDGKQVGPNLDGIGNRGLDRLAEDILAPSRNVDTAFLSTLVATTDGQNHVGLLKSELDAQLMLINLKGEEIVIPAGTVEQRSTSRLSPMPANLVATLSLQDRCDLIAFLLTQRASPSN
jgi:putative heme-binding domain-containing protein